MSVCEFAKASARRLRHLQMRDRKSNLTNFQNGGERFSFSPGEKAGMRAGVKAQIANQFV
jgi:hypothetical protein